MLSNLIIYGGSFDPIHNGHLNTALAVQEAFHFERFLFLPCKIPVLKRPTEASTEQRIAMLKFAIKPYPYFQIDLREMNRKTPSYMVNTLENFREELGLNTAITLLIGLDAFVQFHKWYRWKDILKLSHLLVIERPPVNKKNIPDVLKEELKRHETYKKHTLLNSSHGKIFLYNAGQHEVSSTQLREQLKQEKSIESYVPLAVYKYIKEKNLYKEKH